MAINRGPWNALVDDDGSNLVGTVWNKDKIKTVILDPTDAAIAPAWTLIPFSAGMYTASAGAWTVAAGNQVTFQYVTVGRTLFAILSLDSTVLSANAVRLFITLPGGVPLPRAVVNAPVTFYGTAGNVTGTGFFEILSGNAQMGILRDIAGTPWPAGSIFLRGEWFYPID